MLQDTQTDATPASAPASAPKKQLPPLSTSQPIASVKKGTPDEGTETIESFAKRIRDRFPQDFTLNGKKSNYKQIPDGKLVYDWLAKYPQYERKLKRGEHEKASLSAYWHEGAAKLKEAGSGIVSAVTEAGKGPFSVYQVIGHAGYEMAAGPLRELAGRPQPERSILSAPRSIEERFTGAVDTLLGGDPASARMNLQANRGAEAAADVFVVPVVGLLTGELARGLPGLRSGPETIGPTAKSNAALMTLMGRELPTLPPAELAERTAQLGGIWKQAAREVGVTDANLKSVLPSRSMFASNKEYLGAIAKGNQVALDIASRAVDIANKPIDTLIDTYGRERVGTMGDEIAATLRRDAADTADEGIAKSLNKLAVKAEGTRTLADLNKIKRHANKEASRLYGGNTGSAINSSAQTVYAYKLAADAIRDRMYPALRELAGGKYQGIDLIELGKRESDAIALRDGMQDIYHRLQGEQANKEALSFGQYVFGEGREHSLYSRHIYRRTAEKVGLVPGPTGIMNQMAKTATGELGAGAQGERVMKGAIRQKALPPIGGTGEGAAAGAGPNTFFFEIPTGLPREVVSPSTVNESLRYEGTRELPRLDHDPYDPNSFQDSEFRGERDGSTGSQSYRPLDNKARRQAIGSSSSATPDRSFSGPATRRATQWQRIVETEGGEVSREGGGILRTHDVKQAQATLDRLREYSRNHPSEQRTLAPAIEKLAKQVADYHAYDGKTVPTAVKVLPGKPGAAARNRLPKRMATGATGAAVTGANERSQRRSLPPL